MEDELIQLKLQISFLRHELVQLKDDIRLVNSFLKDLNTISNLNQTSFETIKNQQKITQNALKEHISTHKAQNPTIQHITPTHPTDELPLKALKQPKLPISIGNQGVPTNKQTNKQTNQQTDKYPLFSHGKMQEIDENMQKTSKTAKNQQFQQKYDETPENLLKIASGVYFKPQQIPPKTQDKNQLANASELLENLDSLKKEIRRKFKALTPQEFKVFTAIYQLEEQHLTVDYTLLSKKLKLSESSIRDYIGRIISKGVPIIKEKINNKQVIVHISADLKKIASLAAILQLREL